MSSVGPVPLGVVWVLLGWLLAIGVARWLKPLPQEGQPTPGAMLLDMVFLGLLGGRVAFVVLHWRQYAADPWALLRLGDGGFLPVVAVLVGLAWAAWRLRRWPGLRRPVWAGAAAGVVCWAGLTLGMAHLQQARITVPELTLQSLQGEPMALADQQGKPMVINLWATWCAPCRREMPLFAAAQQREPGVRFVFLNQGESAEEVQQFLTHQRLELQHVLLDADSLGSERLQVHAYPTTLFFDSRGRLQGLHMGELSAAGLQARLDALR
ncbi:redoxin domain-containing protein [Bacillus subtilis subsp. subtilis]|nr:redoxin domain-containing protein [Bacillus subtilis subsp. subtilis]